METRLGAWEEEEEERTTRHVLVVAASTPPAFSPGLMSSAANHFAGGPEAGRTSSLQLHEDQPRFRNSCTGAHGLTCPLFTLSSPICSP
ncbi:rCG44411 [Rattus norvegicus]|uniref:RCG44411 n=1 Tax=Rattus norvegicus TaxID=10116 RepID=A6I573_RAT|nr:rCG44411 [Rattus norvegicus]